MMSFIFPMCTFDKYANVPLKIIRHLEPVKGIFVSWKHSNVILYPRGCVDHRKLRLDMVLRSFEVFFIVKQCELRIL